MVEYLNYFKVLIVNSSIVAVTSLTDIETILKIVAVLIGIGYGIWKWKVDYKKEKKN